MRTFVGVLEGLAMKTKLLGVVAALALSVASPVLADTITVTYAGTVSAGTDFTGVFGPPSTLLDGDAFVLTYAFDTSKGLISSGAGFIQLAGGPGFGPGIYSSPGTAVLTINAVSVNFIVDPNPPSQGFSDAALCSNALDLGDLGRIGGDDQLAAFAVRHTV